MNKTLSFFIVVVVIIVAAYFALYAPAKAPAAPSPEQSSNIPMSNPPVSTATSSSPSPTTTPSNVQPYGDVTLSLSQVVQFKDISIKPISIEQDSRCPKDVQCIQAGTVQVKIAVSYAQGASMRILKIGESLTIAGATITFAAVEPDKVSKVQLSPNDYQLTFNVVKQVSTTKPPTTAGKCYVGGCSKQLCTDDPNAISICIYTAAFACYKTATCERQPSGKCDWTPTTELNACLESAKNSSAEMPQ